MRTNKANKYETYAAQQYQGLNDNVRDLKKGQIVALVLFIKAFRNKRLIRTRFHSHY
jgi:hypothetical protein